MVEHYVNKGDLLKIITTQIDANLTKSQVISVILSEIEKLTTWTRCLSIVKIGRDAKGE